MPTLIGHILCRNCLVKHIIEGKVDGGIEVMGMQGRRCNQVLEAVGIETCKNLERSYV
jgi:hypothetical protein